MNTAILREDLEKHITPEMEAKHFNKFSRRAGYLGNGIYGIEGDLYSNDTRELFLMFCARNEKIKFVNE
jgi:hypothetical protein